MRKHRITAQEFGDVCLLAEILESAGIPVVYNEDKDWFNVFRAKHLKRCEDFSDLAQAKLSEATAVIEKFQSNGSIVDLARPAELILEVLGIICGVEYVLVVADCFYR